MLGEFFVPILTVILMNVEFLINKLNKEMENISHHFLKSLIYLPGGMSRFQCAEFIAQITEAIEKVFHRMKLTKYFNLMNSKNLVH